MIRQFVAAILWFLATWAGGDLVALVLGAPRWPMPVVAVAVAAAVWVAFGRWDHPAHARGSGRAGLKTAVTGSEG